ncbi:hypothetical protein HYU40_04220 [Candidatus Woesearchaeota archaeon]|nr:hypothetical protein [Candidatus Woesearchaeota archaeon]
MALSTLDQMLGIQAINSIEEFKSSEARELAAKYGISLTAIPELRKKLYDVGEKNLESRVAAGDIPASEAAQMLAVQAMFFYEQSARKAAFKLVGDGLTGVIAKIYGGVDKVNPNAAKMNASFGKLYAEQAAKYTQK